MGNCYSSEGICNTQENPPRIIRINQEYERFLKRQYRKNVQIYNYLELSTYLSSLILSLATCYQLTEPSRGPIMGSHIH
jgi:hypothetical protein